MPPFSAFNLGTHVGDDPAAVAANRAALAARLADGADGIVWMDQVHSATVVVVDRVSGPVGATDGVVSIAPGLALAVLVADCVPILAFDEAAGVIAAAHAGRLGASDGIALRMLETMASVGADRSRITVVLGPAICGSCYEVPPEMQRDVERRLPGSGVETRTGTTGLDLRRGLHRQLADSGVAAVERSERCTFTDDTLFSHRRGAPTGRQAGLIWRTP